MHNTSDKTLKHQLVSLSVFLFFSLTLTIKSGYSYGAAALLLLSLATLSQKPANPPAQHVKSGDRVLAYILLLIFMVSLLMTLLHREAFDTLDQASRYLLIIPILFLLRKTPPDIRFMWAGLAVGAVGAAGIGYWQVNILGIGRATGFVTSAIPFGGIALSMGVLCLAGLPWASTQPRFRSTWNLVLVIGFCAGIYCSVASGSRGTWIALLPLSMLFIISFSEWIKGYRGLAVALIMVGAIVILFSTSDTMQGRYKSASHQLNSYMDESNANSSVGERLEAWRAAWINIRQKPLIGWSQKAYRTQIANQISRGEIAPSVSTLVNSHNNYLEVWIFQGLPGLIALLALFVYTFYIFVRRIRDRDPRIRSIGLAGAALVTSFFSFGLTQVILGRNNGIMFFLLTLVILWTSLDRGDETNQRPADLNP